MRKLMVLFPGIGYHCDKPLLYYGKKLGEMQGYTDCIKLLYSYDAGNIRGNIAGMEKAFQSMYAQTKNQLRAADFGQYDEILFMSKSIGTVIAAAYAEKHSIKCKMVLYTPLVQTYTYHIANGIAFIGQKDPWSDVNKVILASQEQDIPIYLYENANHSLETDDVIQNLNILKDVMVKTKRYLSEKESKMGLFKKNILVR